MSVLLPRTAVLTNDQISRTSSDCKVNMNSHTRNRDTQELRKFWVFPANPGVEINFYY